MPNPFPGNRLPRLLLPSQTMTAITGVGMIQSCEYPTDSKHLIAISLPPPPQAALCSGLIFTRVHSIKALYQQQDNKRVVFPIQRTSRMTISLLFDLKSQRLIYISNDFRLSIRVQKAILRKDTRSSSRRISFNLQVYPSGREFGCSGKYYILLYFSLEITTQAYRFMIRSLTTVPRLVYSL